jgi:hypothetical protein
MNKPLILLVLLTYTWSLNAQTVQRMAGQSLSKTMNDIDLLMKVEIGDKVKLIGIGDMATLAKETQAFNTSLCAYLITNKGFRNIFLLEDEWLVRPLNGYVSEKSPLDTVKLNSLMLRCLSGPNLNNLIFKSFLIWLKTYNLSHPDKNINLYGVTSNTAIPSSYFLSAYIFPIDRVIATAFAKKWDNGAYSEEQSLKDIEEWCSRINQADSSSMKKQLIEECKKDIDHNKNIFRVQSTEQKFSVDNMEKQSLYISGQIVYRTDKKSILFSENRVVVRSDYVSILTYEPRSMPTIGKLIHRKLNSQYYVCATDFSGLVSLPIVDLSTRSVKTEIFSPSEKAKMMILEKDNYFLSKDLRSLKGFLPTTIPFIKGRTNTLGIDQTLAPLNALFLFKTLSESAPIPQ